MIGGIVANNASGMCCGVAQNTYHTMADMRILLADGTVLDTADEQSCKEFLQVGPLACSSDDLAEQPMCLVHRVYDTGMSLSADDTRMGPLHKPSHMQKAARLYQTD